MFQITWLPSFDQSEGIILQSRILFMPATLDVSAIAEPT